jgi:RNA polymerase sigma-70 factor (ECF subfamily)
MSDTLHAAWLTARAAWPGVDVAEEELAAFVAERRPRAEADRSEPPEGEPKLLVDDLYLACACARGDPVALAAFERAFFSEIDGAMHRRGGPGTPSADDVRQLVRKRLFVGEDGARPKIAEYSGRGTLRSWLRVMVTRMVINATTRAVPETPFADDALMFLLGGSGDPELEYAKRTYEAEFRAAFKDALAALEPRERSLVRYAFGDGLTVDAVGSIYGVHRATAARWIVSAHRSLLSHVQRLVSARLGISEDEYSSALRLVLSRLDLSLERYLKDGGAEG